MPPSDRDLAVSANVQAYTTREEWRQVSGSPHLRHASIRHRLETLIDQAIASIGFPPSNLSVLEVGAGDGLASIPWFRRGVRLTAVDCSAEMLARMERRAAADHLSVRTFQSDAVEFFGRQNHESFDVICFTSMLHHIPDYIALLKSALPSVKQRGCILTFQDPLRYDRVKLGHHLAQELAYLAWRLRQRDALTGIRARLRRRRGEYLPTEPNDFEEYHVVRNGVDSDLIVDALRPHFNLVQRSIYWSTQDSIMQRLGEWFRLESLFGVLATGRV